MSGLAVISREGSRLNGAPGTPFPLNYREAMTKLHFGSLNISANPLLSKVMIMMATLWIELHPPQIHIVKS